jgi:hypothetical protein
MPTELPESYVQKKSKEVKEELENVMAKLNFNNFWGFMRHAVTIFFIIFLFIWIDACNTGRILHNIITNFK